MSTFNKITNLFIQEEKNITIRKYAKLKFFYYCFVTEQILILFFLI